MDVDNRHMVTRGKGRTNWEIELTCAVLLHVNGQQGPRTCTCDAGNPTQYSVRA